MEYQNVDEATRREACEQLKKIVNAIKELRIKYYLNFPRISVQDQQTYQKLQYNLEKIAEENGLNNLKVALMQRMTARYGEEGFGDNGVGESPNNTDNDKDVEVCYGAIDAQKEAISKGRIGQAIRCQDKLKEYMARLDEASTKSVIDYKRQRFAELGQSRELLEDRIKTWETNLQGMYKNGPHAQKRKYILSILSKCQTNEKTTEHNTEGEDITI